MTDFTRRSLLAAAAAAPLWSAAPANCRTAAPRRILVLGGTGFLGPHFVRAALANGHTVTLFNRGRTNVELFPDLEKLRGDRNTGDLASLQGRTFDAVVDTSGYVPAHVEATARLFADRAEHYQFISTVSVYGGFGERADRIDETTPVESVDDDKIASISEIRQVMPFYGPLKARCESAAEAAMPGRVANIRPGLIVGPGDNSDRFTWWPWRIHQGGEVLAPGEPDAGVQFLDVRDLAAFMLHCLESGTAGIYNAVGFAGKVTMGDVLSACKCATSSPVELTWVDEAFLLGQRVRPYMEMPLWLPGEVRSVVDNRRAMGQGLRFMPVAETIRDTLAWALAERGNAPFRNTGLAPEREQALLAAWRQQRAGDGPR